MLYFAWSIALGKVVYDPTLGVFIDRNTYDEKIKLMKYVVKNYIFWTLEDIIKALKSLEEGKTLPAILWDDCQVDAPSGNIIPRRKRMMIEYLITARQRVANIILTAPSMSDIAKPLRRNINFEIIVPRRGFYEVQAIIKRRDFYNPTEDVSQLWYVASGQFDPLPQEVDELYKSIRDEQFDRFTEILGINSKKRGKRE